LSDLGISNTTREFIAYVESAFKNRGLRCDVLVLSPKLSESAVIRRQVVEGVLAVVRLSRLNQATGKLPVKLFDRSAGVDNVKFEGEQSSALVILPNDLRLRKHRSSDRARSRSPSQIPP
jgi:hypothetical protein